MSDLALRQDNEIVPISAETSPLVLWAYEARQAAQIATSLAKTSFVPASLRGKPEDVTAAILAGQELGLRPMATLRSMDVIQGTPALRAHAMRGLVQSHGHEVQLVESTETRCKMRGRRRGEEDWQTVLWTAERAGKLGLLGKDQWKKQQQTMLICRATGEICRLIASDVLHAMPYAAEELTDDLGDVEPMRVEAKAGKRKLQRDALSTQPVPPPQEPELEQLALTGSTEAAEPLFKQQMSLMQKLFTDAGIADPQAKRDYCTQQLGRDITSVADLSVADASRVIDALTPVQEPPFDDDVWPDVPAPGGSN